MGIVTRAGVVALALVRLAVPSSTAAADSAVVLVTGSGPGLTPATLAERYQATAGPAGARAGIAVVSPSEPSLEDIANFRARAGLGTVTVNRVVVEGGVRTDDPAMTVLLEWAGALAPDAPLTAVVGDPWAALSKAILDNLAPVIVAPALETSTPPRIQVIIQLFYAGRLLGSLTLGRSPDEVVIASLLAVAEQHGQTIVVPTGSPIAGRRGVVAVGGSALVGDIEAVWRDAAGASAPGADVAAFASPLSPGYGYDWQGSTGCCAGGGALAAAVWGGVAARLIDASGGSLALPAFLDDAGRRQGVGGIAAFTDITLGVPPPPQMTLVQAPPAPGFDELTGFGSPLVGGLEAALDCRALDCGEFQPGFDLCGQHVCRPGGVCDRIPANEGMPCFEDACLSGQTCSTGACTAGTPITCTDASACTADGCDSDIGCVHALDGSSASCQLLDAGRSRRACGLDWLVETASSLAGKRRVGCTDGDPSCDHDALVGQCTFHVSVCDGTGRGGCPATRLRVARPSARDARRSALAATVRRTLGDQLYRAPDRGQCTAAVALAVPVGRTIEIRVEGRRRPGRFLKLACRSK